MKEKVRNNASLNIETALSDSLAEIDTAAITEVVLESLAADAWLIVKLEEVPGIRYRGEPVFIVLDEAMAK